MNVPWLCGWLDCGVKLWVKDSLPALGYWLASWLAGYWLSTVIVMSIIFEG